MNHINSDSPPHGSLLISKHYVILYSSPYDEGKPKNVSDAIVLASEQPFVFLGSIEEYEQRWLMFLTKVGLLFTHSTELWCLKLQPDVA